MTRVNDLEALIERSDLDGLVVAVERCCEDDDWDAVVDTGERCRSALARGRQLWPVVSYVEYRLALSGPANLAARVLTPGRGRFSLGPLAEVAAMNHSWESIAVWLDIDAGPVAGVFGHERVVRGEDLCAQPEVVNFSVFELPLRLQEWEPSYPLAVYHPLSAEFPAPELPPPTNEVKSPVSGGGDSLDGNSDGGGDDGVRALLELATVWTTESDGRAEAVTVRGDALAALAKLGVGHARLVSLSLQQAMSLMAWTSASGGAHGRRRGMAAGRFGAWWALAALSGALDDWPLAGAQLVAHAERLRWWRWDAAEPETGWSCRLVVEAPGEGLAWALSATDSM